MGNLVIGVLEKILKRTEVEKTATTAAALAKNEKFKTTGENAFYSLQ